MVDFTKPVTTRDGRKVRILCTDCTKKGYPVIGLVVNESGTDDVAWWTSEGKLIIGALKETKWDLINPPVKKYINLFKNGPGKKYFDSKEEATKLFDKLECEDYIKTIEVEI